MSKSTRCACILCMIILPSIILAQEWVVRYNGPANYEDWARAIAVDDLGNVYVTGESHGSGTGLDYATVKYNSSGIEQWVARYNGPAGSHDIAYAIAVDDLGNVYVTGESYADTANGTDCATVKYDAAGIQQWVARYNGPGSTDDKALALAVDDLGNVYVTGYSGGLGTGYDYATVKYDSSGIEQWVARYNGHGSAVDMAHALVVDDLGNVYVTGEIGADIELFRGDYGTVKYDSSGIEQWVARYNGPAGSCDRAYAIVVDDLGNVYVTGESDVAYLEYDYATVKYDAAGHEQWVARYDGPGNFSDRTTGLAVDNLGNVYVTGYSEGDYTTVKYDSSSGIEQWVARYNGPDDMVDWPRALAVDDLGNVYVTGESVVSLWWPRDSDYATVKYDSSGVEQWVARYDGPGNDLDTAWEIAVDDLGNVYVTGKSYGSGTNLDYATIKYSLTGIEDDEVTIKKVNEITATIFRGPLQLPQDTKYRVFDITGRVVEPARIAPGIYFVEIDDKVVQKVIKIR